MESAVSRTILMVDDDDDFLDQMGARLEADGFKVLRAEGQARAEELLRQGVDFDLAVVDLMMEHMDSGFVLCHEIKRRDATRAVILATGVKAETGMDFDTATDEERSWVHADATLAKPIRYEQLRREIDRLLARQGRLG
jgi:CheY-like chemotaxis protein